jgi:hypothetical protein
MWLIAGVGSVLAAVIIISRMRVSAVETAPFGTMSEQWLAEQRASHSP